MSQLIVNNQKSIATNRFYRRKSYKLLIPSWGISDESHIQNFRFSFADPPFAYADGLERVAVLCEHF